MPSALPSIPDGLRVYAIGDIHGCLNQLRELVAKIEDDAAQTSATVRVIFLGDYIDRGLYSKQTIDFMLDWRSRQKDPPVFIRGNHEQVMRTLLKTPDRGLLQDWFAFGGRETLLSYGFNSSAFAGGPEAIFSTMKEKIPAEHRDFLEQLHPSVSFGDYFFCHAGVRPGVPLENQNELDLMWIRYEFLNCTDSFGKIVVHGHTISHKAEFYSNRIGIDTGAYATGCLTAIGLEGTKQWLLQTGQTT